MKETRAPARINLVVFEDSFSCDLYPLSVSHPVFDLLVGCFFILERFCLVFKPRNVILICRDYLAGLSRLNWGFPVNELPSLPGELLLVNAAIKPQTCVFQDLLKCEPDSLLYSQNRLIGGRLRMQTGQRLWSRLLQLPIVDPDFDNDVRREDGEWGLFRYLWDVVDFNPKAIEQDIALLARKATWRKLIHRRRRMILVHREAVVPRGAFIDDSGGPVVIDAGAVLEPRSLVQGPAYIGKQSRVMAGMIRSGCSLGPVCKVGGEIENSIFLGFANKPHEGFIGHSYVGEWTNLGALTTNSDLKNNYAPVKVTLNRAKIDTGLVKVGSFIGDHTKTGIGTLLNTGMVIGFCCNLFGGGFFAGGEIGHFRWGTATELTRYRLEKAVEVASVVMARRQRQFGDDHRRLFEYIYALDDSRG